jgi:cell wall-associated NlpC family hydrolase
VQARDTTADTVAAEIRLDPATLRAAWAKADLVHQEAMLAALTQLGVAYRGYKSDPGVGFDCSGLTSWAWGRAGLQIAHQSGSQINAARRVDQSEAVAGDLVQYPGHVMLYLGVDRAIVHASNPSTDVELSFVPRSVRFGDPTG